MGSFTASADLLVYTCEFDVLSTEPLTCLVNSLYTATVTPGVSYVWDSTLLAYVDPAFPDDAPVDFCVAIRDALNTAVADPTWNVYLSSTNKVVITRNTTFTIDWSGSSGQRMMATLGYTAALSAATSYTATNTPWYYMEAAIAGRTDFSDVYEPEGDVVVSESVSVTGYSRSVSDENAELMVDWLQNMESYASTFIRGRAASLDSDDWEIAAYTWEALITYLRGERLLFVYNSFLGPAWTVHKLRATGATHRPERVIKDDNTYWGIRFLTREVGTIDVGAPTVTIAGAVVGGFTSTGDFSLGKSLVATEIGNVTSRKWQASSTWVGAAGVPVGWTDIAGATNPVFVLTVKEMGYQVRCVSTGTGGSGTSNTMKYDLSSVAVCLEAWDVQTLGAGALTTLTGIIGATALTQANAGKRPVVSLTSFGGVTGLTFDGTDDCLRVASTALFANTKNVRIVMALIDTATAASILIELTASVAAQADAFAVAPNSFSAGTISQFASSGAAAVGGVHATQSLASACYASFGLDTNATNGNAFVRANGSALGTTNELTGCTPAANFATGIALNLGARNDGASLPWAGTIGGAIVILSGTAQDATLTDVEAYVARGAALV